MDSSSMIAVDSQCWRLYLGAQPAARTAPGGAIALMLVAEARVPKRALHERYPAIGLQRRTIIQQRGAVHGCVTRHPATLHDIISLLGTLAPPGSTQHIISVQQCTLQPLLTYSCCSS